MILVLPTAEDMMSILDSIKKIIFKTVGNNERVNLYSRTQEQNNIIKYEYVFNNNIEYLRKKCEPFEQTLNAYLDMFSHIKYNIIPRKQYNIKDQKKADEAAKIVEDTLHRSTSFNIKAVLKNLAWYRIDGIAMTEIVFDDKKDATTIKGCFFRPLESFNIKWDSNGHIEKMIDNKTQGVLLPEKCLIMRRSHKDSPTNLAGMKETLIEMANRYIEWDEIYKRIIKNNMSNFIIFKTPTICSGMSQEEKNRIADIEKKVIEYINSDVTMNKMGHVINIGSDVYESDGKISVTPMFSFERIEGTQHDTTVIQNAMDLIAVQMATLLLCRYTITGSHGMAGSYNFSAQQQEQDYNAYNAIVDDMFDEVNAKLIPLICLANNIDIMYMPKLDPKEIKGNQIDAVTKVINTMAQAQVKLKKETIDAVLAIAGLPCGEGEIEYFSDDVPSAKPAKIVEN